MQLVCLALEQRTFFVRRRIFYTHKHRFNTTTHIERKKSIEQRERAIVIGTWGHTSDKVNKERYTIRAIEFICRNIWKYKTALVKQNESKEIQKLENFICPLLYTKNKLNLITPFQNNKQRKSCKNHVNINKV